MRGQPDFSPASTDFDPPYDELADISDPDPTHQQTMETEHTHGATHPSDPSETTMFLSTPEELEAVRSDIHDLFQWKTTEAGAGGVVVNMSGGIDSSLTAALAVEALGSEHVLGLGLPALKTDSSNMSDARILADGLGIEFHEFHLRPLVALFEESTTELDSSATETAALGNVTARLRMICAYYVANTQSRLVCGTSNRSELLLGYFTKYGDGGADLYPLGSLYKTEVRALAQHVGIPRRIIEKDPSAGFEIGQIDAEDLGATYDVIDPILHHHVDGNECVEDVVADLDIARETARKITEMYAKTQHKRTVPPTTGRQARAGGRAPSSSKVSVTADSAESTVTAARLDDLYSVLANEQCRYVIQFFSERSADFASLPELEDYLRARPQSERPDDNSIRTTLRSSVLPKMAATRLLDFDELTGSIRYYGHPVVEFHRKYLTSMS